MKIAFIQKMKLLNKVKHQPLSIDLLLEVCNLMTINSDVIDDDNMLFKHILLPGSNHQLVLGNLDGVSTKPRLSILLYVYARKENDPFNLRVVVSNKFMDNTVSYTLLFLNIINKENVFDLSATDIDIEQIEKLIRETLILTIKDMKRWF